MQVASLSALVGNQLLLRFVAAWALGCALPAGAGPLAFTTLQAHTCRALPANLALPPDWDKYRASVRICPMRQGRRPAQVNLVSVFVDEYYRGLPEDAPWEDFPTAMIVDNDGRCLARVAHLFPVQPPRELVVSAGRWREGLPTELRFSVRNPAVSGNYTLPTLSWNASTRTYRAPSSASHKDKDPTQCP